MRVITCPETFFGFLIGTPALSAHIPEKEIRSVAFQGEG